MKETENSAKKRLDTIVGKNPDWAAIAKDCVCFANTRGGNILIGIAGHENLPPSHQFIPEGLESVLRKRISELTINVTTSVQICTAENGGQFLNLNVLPTINTIASTTTGQYYYRIDTDCRPLPPEELTRLLSEKTSFSWESQKTEVLALDIDEQKLATFIDNIRKSNRVTEFIKSMSSDELLDRYLMKDGKYLTNLGVLWVGKRHDRARLQHAPVIQFIKYDAAGIKRNKIVWDNYENNPQELIEEIWTKIPDWKEGVEIREGLYPDFLPDYAEGVIRELIANALVHRPYTTRGDIFLNLYPNRLEVHNPGGFPIGVNSGNILHRTVRRNSHLAQVFYDLRLMEREGSGYDRLYEIQMATAKPLPQPIGGDDRVCVIVEKQISSAAIYDLMKRASNDFNLSQREIICFGLIAQHTTLSSVEFSRILALDSNNGMQNWLGRLQPLGLIKSKGKTKGVTYFINPEYLSIANFTGRTDLKNIEDHRLVELLMEDLRIYPGSIISDINNRIGTEINREKVRSKLQELEKNNLITIEGIKKGTRYSLARKT